MDSKTNTFELLRLCMTAELVPDMNLKPERGPVTGPFLVKTIISKQKLNWNSNVKFKKVGMVDRQESKMESLRQGSSQKASRRR